MGDAFDESERKFAEDMEAKQQEVLNNNAQQQSLFSAHVIKKTSCVMMGVGAMSSYFLSPAVGGTLIVAGAVGYVKGANMDKLEQENDDDDDHKDADVEEGNLGNEYDFCDFPIREKIEVKAKKKVDVVSPKNMKDFFV